MWTPYTNRFCNAFVNCDLRSEESAELCLSTYGYCIDAPSAIASGSHYGHTDDIGKRFVGTNAVWRA